MANIDMVGIVVRFERDPLSMLEYGMAGLRQLREHGDEVSRASQTRALVAGLMATGSFGEVAEALSARLFETSGEPGDRELLETVRRRNGR